MHMTRLPRYYHRLIQGPRAGFPTLHEVRRDYLSTLRQYHHLPRR